MATGEVVTLNVGGAIYTTTRSTLTRYPNSMLGRMFDGDLPSHTDHHGNYVIDRDGALFRHILNFLRSSTLALPANFAELDMLAAEADFYQIRSLIDQIEALQKMQREPEVNEYLQVILTKEYLTIFAKADVLKKLPEFEKLYMLSNSEWHDERLEVGPYFGIDVHMGSRGFDDRNLKHTLNWNKLFQEISQLGFVLETSSDTITRDRNGTTTGDRTIFRRTIKNS